MERPRNPFILGHRIERPYFCDRETEQTQLSSAVLNGRNVVLISSRRIGKTSLAYVTLHESEEIDSEFMTISVDILQTNSLGEFTYILGKAIFDRLLSKNKSRINSFLATLKSIKGEFGFDPMNGTPTFNIQLGDIRFPEYTLEDIFKFVDSYEKPVIIVIDEFQQVTKYPENNTEAILRGYIQHMSNATFIFAGSEQTLLQEMFVSAKRPFYNSAEIMHLGPIPEDVYVEFAENLFLQYRKSVSRESVGRMFRLFDGNTFYIQRTLNGAFGETPEGNECTDEVIVRSIKGMLAANEVIYREILSNISISQKSVLLAVAKERLVNSPTNSAFIKRNALTSASAVQSALQKLTKSGYVVKTQDGYSLSDPLMRIFINSLYSTPEV